MLRQVSDISNLFLTSLYLKLIMQYIFFKYGVHIAKYEVHTAVNPTSLNFLFQLEFKWKNLKPAPLASFPELGSNSPS